ncbi:hypothetical protein ABPG75_013149 [Micractinium tetrahymenae]
MEGLSQKALAAVLTAVAIAAKRTAAAGSVQAASKLPTAALLRSGWQHPSVQRASLTWRIPNFMQQQGKLVSPEFGSGQPGCSRTLRLSTGAGSSDFSATLERELTFRNPSSGHSTFVNLAELRKAADRYLVNGAAVIKTDVTWVEKLAGA